MTAGESRAIAHSQIHNDRPARGRDAAIADRKEDADGVDALWRDDRIVKLRRGVGSDRVLTFSLSRCSVSALCGAA